MLTTAVNNDEQREAAGQEVFRLHVVPRYPEDGVVITAEWNNRPRELLDQDAATIRESLV